MPGPTQRSTRLKELHIVAQGAGGQGHEPNKGSGAIVPFKIVLPVTQTVDAMEIVTPTGVVLFSIGANGGQSTPTAITASGAVAVRPSRAYIITNAGVTAMTLAAPTAGTDDGVTISITSTTAFAHTLTATGLLQTGSAAQNVATFAPFAGAGLTLRALNGKWVVVSSTGITFS